MAIAEPAPSCFAYAKASSPDLAQGDILAKSGDLKEVIRSVHPFFLKDDYTHFIVLTQSCDLVRRGEKRCKVRYITLAAVRPLSRVVEREIERYQSDFERLAEVCSQTGKARVEQFLERLLNNNAPEFFYLHEEPALGFPESACAFLNLPISLRASQHYDTCMRSRLLSLTDVFQAKLGWLTGNIYSRVGTPDWVPDHISKEDFSGRISDILDRMCRWIDDKQLKQAKQSAPDELLAQGAAALRDHIDNTKVQKRRGVVVDAVIQELRTLELLPDAATEETLKKRLSNNTMFRQYTDG
jgi:hypothetical protein